MTTVLVTGASGSLGKAVVNRLLADGKTVRGFVRRIPESPPPGVEYTVGDLADPLAVDKAALGVDTVIHAGAAMKDETWSARVASVARTVDEIHERKQR
jgi:uncharacterized protein YbjT (DUF2867 family)